MQGKPVGNVLYICRYDVTHTGFKTLQLYNFVTKSTKMPQNVVQGSFSMKLIKICHKNRSEILASDPL